ncbi:MAG: GNAT family N-acetyltransferase [Planctomycetota bacterium]
MIQWKTIVDPDGWRSTLHQFARRDFFHTYEYHQLHNDQGDPLMQVAYKNGSPQFAFPFLRRSIDDQNFDFTSVYGYPGPLIQNSDEAAIWWQRWQDHIKHSGAVALFSRLHPMLHQELIQSRCENVELLSHTIAIPCLPDERRLMSYKKTTRYEIRKLIQAGGRVEFCDSKASMDVFQELYYATMKGLNANDYYFFSREYLDHLMQLPGISATIGTVYLEEQPIAVGLFTVCGETGQYYLGGSNWEFRKWAPSKLLLHTAVDWAARGGAQYLHLGGGMGNDTDGLFRFKSGFSQDRWPFATVRMILDRDKYLDLSKKRADELSVSIEEVEESGYFPNYRWQK